MTAAVDGDQSIRYARLAESGVKSDRLIEGDDRIGVAVKAEDRRRAQAHVGEGRQRLCELELLGPDAAHPAFCEVARPRLRQQLTDVRDAEEVDHRGDAQRFVPRTQ